MIWQYFYLITPLLIALAIALALLAYLYKHHNHPAANSLFAILLGTVIWIGTTIPELMAADMAAKMFWSKFQYIGILMVPISWLIFSCRYTNRDAWINRKNLILLSIFPTLTLLMVWTNELHHLIWTSVTLQPVGQIVLKHTEHGWWFWLHTTYSYALLFIGTLLFIVVYVQSPRLYRRQSALILVGVLMPWLANVVYLWDFAIPALDLTPFALVFFGLTVVIGMVMFQLLDIRPVARRTLIDQMQDGVFVLDIKQRILDINPAAARLIHSNIHYVVGRPVGDVLKDFGRLIQTGPMNKPVEAVIQVNSAGEVLVTRPSAPNAFGDFYEIQCLDLTDTHHRPVGKLVVFHNITTQKQTEAALRRAHSQLEDRVKARTAELAKTNQTLRAEIEQRTQAETALRQSEQKYKQLVEYAPAGIYEINMNTLRFESVNDIMCQYSGYTREEFLKLNPLDLLTEDGKQLLLTRQHASISGGDLDEQAEYQIKAKSGQKFWVLLHSKQFVINGEARLMVVVHNITQRKLLEQKIQASLEEKEVLLKEIHHRVKNNLQIVSSILSLQSFNIADQQARQMLQESRNRIRSMASIHDMLYRSDNLAQIDFGEYVEDIGKKLLHLHAKNAGYIIFNVDADSIFLTIDSAIPCGLILNELMTNALKHAFPNGSTGQINLTLKATTDSLVSLTVRDNGIGISPDFDLASTDSLGLVLVRTLVDQLDGTLGLAVDHGTCFTVTFPLPAARPV